MRFLMRIAALVAGTLAGPGVALADDPKDKDKPTGPVILKVISKKDGYVFDGAGKTPKEFKEYLEDLQKKQENRERISPPKPLAVDLVLQLENVSKENVIIYVGGTSNVYTFELTGGAGVVNLRNPVAMPALVRLPMAVTLEPGKSHEIPVTTLADGRRGISRLVLWTGPGDYSLTARYVLLDPKGGKNLELQSEPTKLKVTEK